MGVFLVGRSGEHDLLHSMAEVAIEPAYKSMDNAIQLDVESEGTVEVQFGNCNFFKIDIVELEGVGENVLMVNWINNGLREHPFLHALHANSIDIVPKTLS